MSISSFLGGLFGGGAPEGAAPTPGKPRWWDYALGLATGYLPSAVNDAFEQRQYARDNHGFDMDIMRQAANMARPGSFSGNEMYGFGGRRIGGGAPWENSPQQRAMPMPQDMIPGFAGPTNIPAPQPQFTGRVINPDDPRGAPMANAPFRGAGDATASAGERPVFVGEDGRLREYHDLMGDPQYAGFGALAAMSGNAKLKAMSDYYAANAKDRKPDWQFNEQAGGYVNTNSGDPRSTYQRMGTKIDPATGLYIDVGPDGKPVAGAATGFNDLQAAQILSKGGAENEVYQGKTNIDVSAYKDKEGFLTGELGKRDDHTTRNDITLADQTARFTDRNNALQFDREGGKLESIQVGETTVTGTRAALNRYVQSGGTETTGVVIGQKPNDANRKFNEDDNQTLANLATQRENLNFAKELLTSGRVKLGLVENGLNELGLRTGMGGQGVADYQNFKSTITGLVNRVTEAQVGPQTNADVQRLSEEILSGRFNHEATLARLNRLIELADKADATVRARIQQRGGQIYDNPSAPPAANLGQSRQSQEAGRVRQWTPDKGLQ